MRTVSGGAARIRAVGLGLVPLAALTVACGAATPGPPAGTSPPAGEASQAVPSSAVPSSAVPSSASAVVTPVVVTAAGADATRGAGAGPGGPPPAGRRTGDAAARAPVARYTSAVALSAAIVAAVRARGSVLVTATTVGTSLVSRRWVHLVDGQQNALYEVSGPGASEESLLLIGDTPYLPVDHDPLGRHWTQMRFDDLAGGTWSNVIYLADLPTTFGAWRMARTLQGGDVATVAGESVRGYVLTLGPDVSAAQLKLDRVPEASQQGVRERLSRLTYDLIVTVGPDDLPRTITQTAPESGLTTVQQFTRWGQVTVSPPAPDDVRRPDGDR
ncbi:MAG TPA: hypothetical protein VI248_09080 [Kineosporiaceae bacterium]